MKVSEKARRSKELELLTAKDDNIDRPVARFVFWTNDEEKSVEIKVNLKLISKIKSGGKFVQKLKVSWRRQEKGKRDSSQPRPSTTSRN